MKRLAPLLAGLTLAGCGTATPTTVTTTAPPAAPTAAQIRERTLREAKEHREIAAQESAEAHAEAAKRRAEEGTKRVEREHETADQHEAERGVTIPNETGVRLDVAEEELESARLAYKVVGGGLFGVVVTSDWTVCETKPPTGAKVPSGATVRLIVARSC